MNWMMRQLRGRDRLLAAVTRDAGLPRVVGIAALGDDLVVLDDVSTRHTVLQLSDREFAELKRTGRLRAREHAVTLFPEVGGGWPDGTQASPPRWMTRSLIDDHRHDGQRLAGQLIGAVAIRERMPEFVCCHVLGASHSWSCLNEVLEDDGLHITRTSVLTVSCAQLRELHQHGRLNYHNNCSVYLLPEGT